MNLHRISDISSSRLSAASKKARELGRNSQANRFAQGAGSALTRELRGYQPGVDKSVESESRTLPDDEMYEEQKPTESTESRTIERTESKVSEPDTAELPVFYVDYYTSSGDLVHVWVPANSVDEAIDQVEYDYWDIVYVSNVSCKELGIDWSNPDPMPAFSDETDTPKEPVGLKSTSKESSKSEDKGVHIGISQLRTYIVSLGFSAHDVVYNPDIAYFFLDGSDAPFSSVSIRHLDSGLYKVYANNPSVGLSLTFTFELNGDITYADLTGASDEQLKVLQGMADCLGLDLKPFLPVDSKSESVKESSALVVPSKSDLPKEIRGKAQKLYKDAVKTLSTIGCSLVGGTRCGSTFLSYTVSNGYGMIIQCTHDALALEFLSKDYTHSILWYDLNTNQCITDADNNEEDEFAVKFAYAFDKTHLEVLSDFPWPKFYDLHSKEIDLSGEYKFAIKVSKSAYGKVWYVNLAGLAQTSFFEIGFGSLNILCYFTDELLKKGVIDSAVLLKLNNDKSVNAMFDFSDGDSRYKKFPDDLV